VMEAIKDSLLQVLSVAEACASGSAQLPALILTYSAIDAMGWLYAADAGAPVRRGLPWVERYSRLRRRS
jgi:hypothetical protein